MKSPGFWQHDGALARLLAQVKAVGHPFMGIIEPNLREYTHLGDAASQTDGRIYSAKLGPLEVEGNFSGGALPPAAARRSLPSISRRMPPKV